MARHKMYIVNKDMSGKLISGICAGCGLTFQFEDTPEGRRVEKAFETHDCKCEAPTQTPTESILPRIINPGIATPHRNSSSRFLTSTQKLSGMLQCSQFGLWILRRENS